MSFVRKSEKKSTPPPGTRILQNSVLSTSSGMPDLDSLLGGGLLCSGVCIVLEDELTSYHKIMTDYFISEGFLIHIGLN